MNSIVVLLIAALGIGIGYLVYAKRIDQNIVQPSPDKATPARMYMDGVDFTPASRNVLFGYQFKSVAALAPLTGPVIAVQWGWLPALAWIILGVFFIGWVQDYGAMIMGVRRDGEEVGTNPGRIVPIYEYKAKKSNKSCAYCVDGFEHLQTVNAPPLPACPQCGNPVIKILSTHAVGPSQSGADDRAKSAGSADSVRPRGT